MPTPRSYRQLVSLLLPAVLALAAGCRQEPDTGQLVVAGHVEATEVRLSTKIGGTLEWFPIAEGDRVDRGQEVARIDTVDLDLALRAARAQLELARAELALRQAGYRREDVAEAEARLAAARASLAAARRDRERFEGLLEAGSGTEKARDDAATRYDLAAREVDAAEERLRKLRAGFRREEIDAARARLGAAEARVAQIEQQIRDATVRSPAAGTVSEKLVEPGELLAPGSPLVVVTDLEHPWLTAYVGERDLGRIRLGQEAEVITDDGQTRTGRLAFIDSEAEFTPRNVQTRDERVKLVYRVKIALDNPDGLFKAGMPAEATLERQASEAPPPPAAPADGAGS